ncbi:MAG: nicotinate-nucleotide adenylyltransferase [Terriglobia bacterium]
MKIAFFGGTFDPIHVGHLEAARAARRRFGLGRVLFVPAGHPPHKRAGNLAPFEHRFAMVSIACAGEPRLVPSFLEAPGRGVRYSVDTVRELKKSLGSRDRLYFLIGVDAFLDLPNWKQPERLLDETDFIIVSRPGFPIESILSVIPRRMIQAAPGRKRTGTIALRRSEVHLLNGVDVPVSSSDLRAALRKGRSVAGLIPPLVEEYIMKEGVYRT